MDKTLLQEIDPEILETAFREQFQRALDTAEEIVMGKTEDYRSGGVTIKDYISPGVCGEAEVFFVDVWKKVMRLKSLLSSESFPNNESVDDNILDAINYLAFIWAIRQLQKNGCEQGYKRKEPPKVEMRCEDEDGSIYRVTSPGGKETELRFSSDECQMLGLETSG